MVSQSTSVWSRQQHGTNSANQTLLSLPVRAKASRTLSLISWPRQFPNRDFFFLRLTFTIFVHRLKAQSPKAQNPRAQNIQNQIFMLGKKNKYYRIPNRKNILLINTSQTTTSKKNVSTALLILGTCKKNLIIFRFV